MSSAPPLHSIQDPEILWTPSNPQASRLWAFKTLIEQNYNLTLETYEALRQWTLSDLNAFWSEVWLFTGVQASVSFDRAVDNEAPMWPRPPFFTGARLNFAQNLLYPACQPDPESWAVLAATENARERVTWAELRLRVRRCAHALRKAGVGVGDRVAGYVGHHVPALVAMLATTSLGALWTAVSPDTGVHAVLDRLQQIEPRLLFADNATLYNGKIHRTEAKLREIAKGLPTLQHLVILPVQPDSPVELAEAPPVQLLDTFLQMADPSDQDIFEQLPPDHPVYILYSSGTTGQPKCIVHGAIGTLIAHKKEHELQSDIRPGDRLFYFTTCSWMMWHWQVSGLASGATLVVYDGSPFRPLDSDGTGEMAMPRLIEELNITHFGTSAKYLSMLEQKNILPRPQIAMQSLRTIFSTGSPLAPSTFKYVYRAFGPEIHLASISGGTDIVSAWAGGSPLLPVRTGEIQTRGLGMALEAWDPTGKDQTALGEPGDLVCVKPLPCQPVAFWGSDGESKYHRSYFEDHPGVWRHGDFVRINPQTGGLVMLGRSDGILKPAGVRFGSAEVYNILLKHFPSVEDALCIGRRRPTDLDETVVLFVKMNVRGSFTLDLASSIKSVIRQELSARHVPGIIDECPEIPFTTNGKKIEVAVKQILCGLDIPIAASVASPDCLDWYRAWNDVH